MTAPPRRSLLEAGVGGPYGPPTFFWPVLRDSMAARKPLSFKDLILTLHDFWSRQGCLILQPYDVEVGAGTLHPATVLRALGPKS